MPTGVSGQHHTLPGSLWRGTGQAGRKVSLQSQGSVGVGQLPQRDLGTWQVINMSVCACVRMCVSACV